MPEEHSSAERRAALATAFSSIASPMLERVVAEAVRAANFFGLSSARATEYGQSVERTFPQALDALREADPEAREEKLDDLVRSVRAVSTAHHVPRIIERGLVSIAFAAARRLIRSQGDRDGFSTDDLDREFVEFRWEFERRLNSD